MLYLRMNRMNLTAVVAVEVVEQLIDLRLEPPLEVGALAQLVGHPGHRVAGGVMPGEGEDNGVTELPCVCVCVCDSCV